MHLKLVQARDKTLRYAINTIIECFIDFGSWAVSFSSDIRDNNIFGLFAFSILFLIAFNSVELEFPNSSKYSIEIVVHTAVKIQYIVNQ